MSMTGVTAENISHSTSRANILLRREVILVVTILFGIVWKCGTFVAYCSE